jgi:hypothetical protein
VTAKKALSKEKAAQSAADQSLAEEKAAHQTIEQSFRAAEEAKADLAQNLEFSQASLTATMDKLASKSSALDHVMVREQKMEI